jgi:DNA-binding PadR family transcriptional regulator
MPLKPRPEIRPTRATRRVLLVLLTGGERLSGYPIGHLAGVSSGSVYVALARLERAGWVTSEWEQNPPPGQRGRRRFYALTRSGRAKTIGLLRPFGLTMPEGDA